MMEAKRLEHELMLFYGLRGADKWENKRVGKGLWRVA